MEIKIHDDKYTCSYIIYMYHENVMAQGYISYEAVATINNFEEIFDSTLEHLSAKLGVELYNQYIKKNYESPKEMIHEKIANDDQLNVPSFFVSGEDVTSVLNKNFDCMSVEVPCPYCGLEAKLQSVIMHLNDEEEISREEIADWLETLDIDIRIKEKQ